MPFYSFYSFVHRKSPDVDQSEKLSDTNQPMKSDIEFKSLSIDEIKQETTKRCSNPSFAKLLYDWMIDERETLSYKCPFGDVPFIQGSRNFVQHASENHHIQLEEYNCLRCGKWGTDKMAMVAHIQKIHSVVVKLENMDYLLRTDKAKWLDKFAEIMPKNGKIGCSVCLKPFKSMHDFKQHFLAKHGAVVPETLVDGCKKKEKAKTVSTKKRHVVEEKKSDSACPLFSIEAKEKGFVSWMFHEV